MQHSPITYVPPARNDIMAFSKSACSVLVTMTGDAGYEDPAVVQGLTDFLHVCGRLLADQLNGAGDDIAERFPDDYD